jgi:preprotein translocase SecE subunit
MLQNLKEFFAEAKAEFKKISWPSPDEIKGSTTVVCVTIGFLMSLLAVYDFSIMSVVNLFQHLFK